MAVSNDLPIQYPPKPSAQIDSTRLENLFIKLFSVIIDPPKSIKCPYVCFVAIIQRLSNPVIQIKGISQIKIPNINDEISLIRFGLLIN